MEEERDGTKERETERRERGEGEMEGEEGEMEGVEGERGMRERWKEKRFDCQAEYGKDERKTEK